MKYNTILFDADGTLFDFHKSEAEAVRKTMTLFSIEPTDERVMKYSEIKHITTENENEIAYRIFNTLE